MTSSQQPTGSSVAISVPATDSAFSASAYPSQRPAQTSTPTPSKSSKSKAAANAHSALANQLLLPTERDDLAFTYLNPADLEASFQNANETDFVDEKADYLTALRARIDKIEFTDRLRSQRKLEAFQQQHLDVYQSRAKYQRRVAAKEILSEAIQKVLQREEAEELREKKRHKLILQKERRAKRAAALKAEKAQESAASLTPSNGNKDDKNKMPGTPSKSSKGKKQDASGTTTPLTGAATKKGLNGTGANRAGLSESKETKPVVKGPSHKEIRSVARHYQNTYDAIWRDMARKDANKTFRLAHSNLNARINNARKTSVLASKEAKKWQSKTTKNLKDLQNKARRGMREMLTFWRRNEREERELRKKAEKEAQDQAKKEEEAREARRQARKLNFLISQTELYTHFIANKINPAEKVEKKTVKDLDFDSDNEDELHQAAMANAQKAFQETQSKARSFNDPSDSKELDIDEEMNFQNPTSLGDILIPQPKLLSCQLKEYQIKGLSWLANLYEQGINGILADEMGLGKTVQSISVMAYLAEKYNIWGPFLVVTPASTLHNWQQEIKKFVPDFKVLPYWGNAKDRKVLRKFWDHKNVKYNRDSQFHVLVTSYQMVVADASYFQKMKWQYMILDEAQAIKSSTSSRWKSLLSFQCRNRLLLTGTPIQNSMQELWALLHFIMPSLFDSHDEFSEWFANDIESHAQSNTQLNHQQLTRLHMILKPFMLRRLKKHVQSELGDKIEEDVYCQLTNRQRMMYKTLRSQISLIDIIERAASGSDDGTQSLMNLVMQFRKVCNHPDLFERADVTSAYNFGTFGSSFGPVRDGPDIEVQYTSRNLISFNIPKLFYRDGGLLDVPCEASPAGFKSKYLNNMLSIWNPEVVNKNAAFSWMRLIDTSPREVVNSGKTGLFERAVARFTYGEQKTSSVYPIIYSEEEDNNYIPDSNLFLISEQNDIRAKANSCSSRVLDDLLNVGRSVLDSDVYTHLEPAFSERALATPITLAGSDRSISQDQDQILNNREVKSVLFPMTLNKEWELYKQGIPIKEFPASNTFPWAENSKMGFTSMRVPSMSKFVTDSGKLSKLDEMLPVLKANDHRVLIYFQMTKMMDLMEEYLTFRQYKYVRLDGSSKLSDRRDLVNDWQTKPELFIFLLSTRAGGLGINLTAADTVIFYDSDWNPTIDSQAMDRAHRMGQTKQVTVYRLLVKGTIEERMRDRAKQKMQVQKVVMEGGGGQAVDFKEKPGREVAYWLLDDDATADAIISKNNTNDGGKSKKRIADANNGTTSASSSGGAGGLELMYHEGEGNFDESSLPPSGVSTPLPPTKPRNKRRRMNTEQRLQAVGSGNFDD